ncbi:MAG: radical SAM protein, partial [Candidatus Odinarchaeota archaeon]
NLNERLAKAFNDFTSLSWAISSKCNLKCKHCRQKPLVELPFKKKLDLIDFIAQNTMIHRITLTGGEPTIHPNIWDLCRYLKRYGFQLLMITNGTSLTNEILNNITRYEIRPVVSLDGTKEIHEGIRGKDSFEKTLRGIKDLENRKIGFNINRVIIPGYDQNEQEFVHLLASFKNIRGISIYRCIPTGKARQSFRYQKNRYYSSLKKLITSFSNSTLKDRIKMHIDDPLIPLHLPKKMLQSTSISYGCLLKDGTISLQPDGSFLACQALPVSIASWNEDLDWDTIKNNPIIKRSYFNEKSLEFFPRECLSCSDFSSCSGGCTAFTFSGGNGITPILLNKKDPYCPKNTYSDL